MTIRECLILLIGAGIICFGMAAWVSKARAAECRGVSGIASMYGSESGARTANGEHFRPWGLTAAYWYAPFNTRLRVTNMRNGRSVVVRTNDRGPDKRLGRLIDLSMGSAAAIGLNGLGRVCVERIG